MIAHALPGWYRNRDCAVSPSSRNDLRSLIEQASAYQEAFPEALKSFVASYLDHLRHYLWTKEISLDGRRLGMMSRAIVAIWAVHRAAGMLTTDELPDELLRHALDVTLPFSATGSKNVPTFLINAAHIYALESNRGRRRILIGQTRLAEQIGSVIEHAEVWEDQSRTSLLVANIVEALESAKEVERLADAAAALLVLMHKDDVHRHLGVSARFHLYDAFGKYTELSLADLEAYHLEAYRMRCVSVQSALHLPNAAKNVLMRMAYKIARQQEKRGQHDLFEIILCQVLERLKHGGLLCLSQG